METEKSIALSEEEKKAIDESGHSEKQIDRTLNSAPTNAQTITPKALFDVTTKKENVLLDTTQD